MIRPFLLSLIFLSLTFSSCEVMEPAIIEGPTILETGQIYAEGIMQALSNEDYDTYTQNFNSEMLAASSISDFKQLGITLSNTLGTYKSIDYFAIDEQDNLILIYYTCNFDKGQVTLKLVMEPEPPFRISGLWFSDFNP